MIRIFIVAAAAAMSAALWAAPAVAACETGGLLDTCIDETLTAPVAKDEDADYEEEEYQRLDGGSYGGRPAAAAPGKTITIGDTVVTLGQTEENAEPWQVSNPDLAEDRMRLEDRAKDGLDPLKTQCYADGCY